MEKKVIKFRLPHSLWERFYALYPDGNQRSFVLQQLIAILLDTSEEHLSLLEHVRLKLREEKEELPWIR